MIKRKPKRTHARRTCKVCKERKARCELPDLNVQVSNEEIPLPLNKKCHRCKTLEIDCFVQPLLVGSCDDNLNSQSKRQKNDVETKEEEDEQTPTIIHTFELPFINPEEDSTPSSTNKRMTTSSSSSQSLDLMGRPFATFAWLVDARTQKRISASNNVFSKPYKNVLQIIDRDKVSKLSDRIKIVHLLFIALPSHDDFRQETQINPTPSKNLLLAIWYLYALLLRDSKISQEYSKQEIAEDINDLGEFISKKYNEVLLFHPNDLASIQAFTLLSTLDPLGLILRAREKKSKPSGSACSGLTILAQSAMNRQKGKVNNMILANCIRLNKMLLSIDDEFIASYKEDLPLEQNVIEQLKFGMPLEQTFDDRDIYTLLGNILLQYRNAIFTVYTRTIQFFEKKIKECQTLLQTGYNGEMEYKYIEEMHSKLIKADDEMHELQQACSIPMMGLINNEDIPNLRLISEEMTKLCLMEQSNIRGCLHVFYLRSMIWPFLDQEGIISPFATYEMTRDMYSYPFSKNDEERANEQSIRQQRIAEIFMELANNISPSDLPSELSKKVKIALSKSGPIRFEAAQETLATFIDCMEKYKNNEQEEEVYIPFGWAPIALICNPIVEAAKILMEVQIATISKVNKESKQAPIWSLLMRKAADELFKLNGNFDINDTFLGGGGVKDLINLPNLSSEIIRDMDSIAMRAKQVLQQRKLQSRAAMTKLPLSSFPLRESSSNSEEMISSNDVVLNNNPVNFEEFFQGFDAFWSQDPLDQLFVAWNQSIE